MQKRIPLPELPSPTVSVVIPVFNEEEVIEHTIKEIAITLANYDFEIVAVDDGSSDGTFGILANLSERFPQLRALRFSRNFGHQAALLAGLSSARGQAVIMMDADGQHPPDLIPELILRWQTGAKVVQALRADDSSKQLAKKSTSKLFYRFFSWLSETNIPAGSADFRLLDRAVVNVVLHHPRSALFLRGFVPWTGFSTEFVDFSPRSRAAGTTKYTVNRMLGLARQGLMRFSVKPLRLATLLGALTCCAAIAYFVYVIVVRLFFDNYVAGWASVAGLLALFSGIQLLVMGILGEYIGMIFDTQLGRPNYIVEEQLEPKRSIPPPPPERL